MKLRLILSLILLLTFGCQIKSETVVTPPQSPTATVAGQPTPLKGGGDTVGGGNTIKKKPIEAYAKKIEKADVYKNRVLPLIEKLKTQFPRLAADFIHLSSHRVWYFIPVSLDKLKSTLIGMYSPEVDQTAVQDLNAVWFDANLFDEMTEENQGRLLIHELVMGVHLLEFKPKLDRCYAKAALELFNSDSASQDRYDEVTLQCRTNYQISVDQASHTFSLSPDDYDAIRKIVIELTDENPNWKLIRQIMDENKLRTYND